METAGKTPKRAGPRTAGSPSHALTRNEVSENLASTFLWSPSVTFFFLISYSILLLWTVNIRCCCSEVGRFHAVTERALNTACRDSPTLKTRRGGAARGGPGAGGGAAAAPAH